MGRCAFGTIFFKVPFGSTGFYWILLDFTGFPILLDFEKIMRVRFIFSFYWIFQKPVKTSGIENQGRSSLFSLDFTGFCFCLYSTGNDTFSGMNRINIIPEMGVRSKHRSVAQKCSSTKNHWFKKPLDGGGEPVVFWTSGFLNQRNRTGPKFYSRNKFVNIYRYAGTVCIPVVYVRLYRIPVYIRSYIRTALEMLFLL